MYFVKLKEQFFLTLDKNIAKEEFANFGSVIGNEFKGIQYNRIPQYCTDTMLEVVPENYRKHFTSGIMKINVPYASPHTDSGVTAVLNFYVQTADAVTVFYNQLTEDSVSTKIKNQTNGSVFKLKDLVPVANFKALPGDVWLLDVTKPHSVIAASAVDRIAFCLHTNSLSFEEVKKIFECPGGGTVDTLY